MEWKIFVIRSLLIIAIINIYWATQKQKQLDMNILSERYGSFTKYFIHSSEPGAVCYFGIISGRLIILYNILILILLEKDSNFSALKWTNLGITILIFVLMLIMNSSFAHIRRSSPQTKIITPGLLYQFRGLFDNSIPYFLCHIGILILLFIK